VSTLPTYQDPQVSFLVLDFKRPTSALLCLESLKRHVKFPHHIIYCHNGVEDYPVQFLKEGLIDQLVMPRENTGLGLGTRALYGACFSPLAVYWQVDQVMGRDFTQDELNHLAKMLDPKYRVDGSRIVTSISLAGPVCGQGVFSERAHILPTALYKGFERGLSAGGAGPWHHLLWREGQLQQMYRSEGWIHFTDWPPLAIDNGRDAIRTNPDGSEWRHLPDTKQLWLLKGPVRERYVYPKLSDAEWARVLETQYWEPGAIPEQEVKDSFTVPQWH
jgi:hypothetical protein